MRISITRLSDMFECDTCGCSYADGWSVEKDGKPWFDMKPVAHCLGGSDFTVEDLVTELAGRLDPRAIVVFEN